VSALVSAASDPTDLASAGRASAIPSSPWTYPGITYPRDDLLTAASADPSDLSSGALTRGSLSSAPTTKATLSAN
jgi:hypothetical protein